VVARGTPPDGDELGRFLREQRHLAGFKIPKAFHRLDALPTGPTGKLFRRALRQVGRDGHLSSDDRPDDTDLL
jgi:non-ribosomal peptide synthetase component E (peptide arylation enzyme)